MLPVLIVFPIFRLIFLGIREMPGRNSRMEALDEGIMLEWVFKNRMRSRMDSQETGFKVWAGLN
jgi:hypothetical protein